MGYTHTEEQARRFDFSEARTEAPDLDNASTEQVQTETTPRK